MQAVILIGHGSLRSASGASMIRIAARLREWGIAPVVEAAFLNYSRPTLADAVAKCQAARVTQIVIQPYFLIAGAYVQHDLAALVAQVAATVPAIQFEIAPVLGDHPAMIQLAQTRVAAALPANTAATTHLLLMAHGTPLPAANAPLASIAAQLAGALGLANYTVAYLDCNAPTIPAGFAQLVAAGAEQIVALPYFLHLGRHVAEDLPTLVAEAQQTYGNTKIILAQHLDYDPRLAETVQARVMRVLAPVVTSTFTRRNSRAVTL